VIEDATARLVEVSLREQQRLLGRVGDSASTNA
jgi:hypothetical protein